MIFCGNFGRLLHINPQFEIRTRELVRSEFPKLLKCDVMQVFERWHQPAESYQELWERMSEMNLCVEASPASGGEPSVLGNSVFSAWTRNTDGCILLCCDKWEAGSVTWTIGFDFDYVTESQVGEEDLLHVQLVLHITQTQGNKSNKAQWNVSSVRGWSKLEKLHRTRLQLAAGAFTYLCLFLDVDTLDSFQNSKFIMLLFVDTWLFCSTAGQFH